MPKTNTPLFWFDCQGTDVYFAVGVRVQPESSGLIHQYRLASERAESESRVLPAFGPWLIDYMAHRACEPCGKLLLDYQSEGKISLQTTTELAFDPSNLRRASIITAFRAANPAVVTIFPHSFECQSVVLNSHDRRIGDPLLDPTPRVLETKPPAMSRIHFPAVATEELLASGRLVLMYGGRAWVDGYNERGLSQRLSTINDVARGLAAPVTRLMKQSSALIFRSYLQRKFDSSGSDYYEVITCGE